MAVRAAVADAVFAHPPLPPLYDAFDGPRDDLPAYVGIADELGAHRVLDAGCCGSAAARNWNLACRPRLASCSWTGTVPTHLRRRTPEDPAVGAALDGRATGGHRHGSPRHQPLGLRFPA